VAQRKTELRDPVAEIAAEPLRLARYYARAYIATPGDDGRRLEAMNAEDLTAFAIERLPATGAKRMLHALGRDARPRRPATPR
jgi:hypothetical protein